MQNLPLSYTQSQKQYHAVALAMFLLATGLLLSRMIATDFARIVSLRFPPQTAVIIISAFFSILAQIGMCFLLVFLVYKFTLKMTAKEIFAFSNFNRTKWYNLIIVIPIGILGIFVTIGISTVWAIFLVRLGFNRPSGNINTLPETFNPLLFILQLFLVAVLPAICEEFAMRGGLFTVLKKRYSSGKFYILMAIAFGLFHQNITQLGYTAFFGAVMTFVVVKTKSVYPAMIIHFINNGLSVYLAHASAYGWLGGNIFSSLFRIGGGNPLALFFGYIAIVAMFIGLLGLLSYVNKEQTANFCSQKFQVRNNHSYKNKNQSLHKKPIPQNNAFFIGAIVLTASFTFFSFLWGLFY